MNLALVAVVRNSSSVTESWLKPMAVHLSPPSPADLHLTKTLKLALAMVDVRVLDHVIVGPGQAFSMAVQGVL